MYSVVVILSSQRIKTICSLNRPWLCFLLSKLNAIALLDFPSDFHSAFCEFFVDIYKRTNINWRETNRIRSFLSLPKTRTYRPFTDSQKWQKNNLSWQRLENPNTMTEWRNCFLFRQGHSHKLRERSVKTQGSSSQCNVCCVLIHTQRGLGLLCPIFTLFTENRVLSVTSSTAYGHSFFVWLYLAWT